MNRKILSIILVLAFAITTSSLALAAEGEEPLDRGTTEGSIVFEDGEVTINKPGESGDDGKGEGDPNGEDVDKEDPNYPYDYFFSLNNVKDDLYFGSHDADVYGRFDSANTKLHNDNGEDTTVVGKYTGVEVKNQTVSAINVLVSVSAFKTGETPNLAGAELRLVKSSAIASGNPTAGFTQYGAFTPEPRQDGIEISDDPKLILKVENGRSVKAAWYGLLDVEQGTVVVEGKAQAALTWDVMAADTP